MFGGNKPKPEHYQQVMEQIEGRADAHLIQVMLLRSLRQAMYQPENAGHFGLNYPAYAHFTSPIRRYPDLLVHRAIRHVIRSRKKSDAVCRVKGAEALSKDDIYPYDLGALLQLGEHCSLTERRADEATRDVVNWLKCEYLQDHVGDQLEGVVTSVTGFGLFVELADLYIEGLVHITSLPRDYYHFEPAHQRLVGENSRRVFRLGDELRVQVARVDLEERKIDFELIESKGSKTRRLSKDDAKRLAKPQDVGRGKKGRSENTKKNPKAKRPASSTRSSKKRRR
jgi:ribonuclease R